MERSRREKMREEDSTKSLWRKNKNRLPIVSYKIYKNKSNCWPIMPNFLNKLAGKKLQQMCH